VVVALPSEIDGPGTFSKIAHAVFFYSEQRADLVRRVESAAATLEKFQQK
jgi:hypothetical protein